MYIYIYIYIFIYYDLSGQPRADAEVTPCGEVCERRAESFQPAGISSLIAIIIIIITITIIIIIIILNG